MYAHPTKDVAQTIVVGSLTMKFIDPQGIFLHIDNCLVGPIQENFICATQTKGILNE